jgi:AcrR family transcriptional regulator
VRESSNRGISRAKSSKAAPPTPSSPPTRDTRDFAQERARTTYLSLLDAAGEVFATRGFDETQTPDIAERAGVSVGTFYRYFGDKRQIFIELVNRHLEQAYERVIGNLTPDVFGEKRTSRDRRAAVDRVIEILFQNTAENPRLHREFLAVAMRDAAVAKIRDDFEERGRAAVAALLSQVVARSRFADIDAAAQVMLIAAQDVALATAGLRGPPPTRAEAAALRAALADMLYRYVYGDP